MPEFRRALGLPWSWHETGARRLGFHGASHRYLAAAAIKAMGSERMRLVTAHLGGSSSLCAIRDGRSVDISTAFSPNSGVLQGTRSGDVDGTAVLFAMKELGLTVDQAQEQISNDAGLLGIAGIGTDDLRAIEEAAEQGNTPRADRRGPLRRRHPQAHRRLRDGARRPGLSRVRRRHRRERPEIRQAALKGLEFMGIRLDLERNKVRGEQALISAADSAVKVWVIPTNEEVVVASFTKRVVELGRDLTPEEMTFRL